MKPRVCDCTEMPVNVWYRGGVEVQRRTLTEVSGASDGEDYLASDCDGWAIVCPRCGLVYAIDLPFPPED
jgi:hypothetical protein